MSEPKYWATYGKTESGDDLKIVLWKHDPTADEVNAFYREWQPIEYEEVGFVHWKKQTVAFAE